MRADRVTTTPRHTRHRGGMLRRAARVGATIGLVGASVLASTGGVAGAVSGSVTITSNGTWTVPAGVNHVTFTVVGGGGGATSGTGITYGGAPGGGASIVAGLDVTPGQVYSFGIGGAGTDGGERHDPGSGGSGGWGTGGGGGTGSLAGHAGAGGGGATYVQYSTDPGPGSGNVLMIAGGGGGAGGGGAFGDGGNGGCGGNVGGGGTGAGAGGPGGVGWNTPGGGDAGSSSSGGGGGGAGSGNPAGGGGSGGGAGGGGGGGGAGGSNFTRTVTVTDVGCAPNGRAPGWVRIDYAQVFSTVTTVTAAPTTAVTGQTVTFTAQVTPQGTTTVPTGTVQMQLNGTDIGDPQPVGSDGKAILPITDLPVGAVHLVAAYTPADPDTFSASVGSTDVTVTKGDTTLLLASTGSPSVAGHEVTFTASAAPVVPAAGVPTGGVQFAVDGVNRGGPVALDPTGQASVSVSSLTVGSHTISAIYTGDTNFNGSTAAQLTQQVNPAGTSVGLVSSANPSVNGQTVTFSATAMNTAPGGAVPTGTVQFLVDGTDLGAPRGLDGTGHASVDAGSLAVGTHPVTAVYSGDASHDGATSATVTQVVNPAGATVLVGAPAGPSVVGDPVSLDATVSASAPGSGTPTGTVQFLVGGVPLGAPVPLVSGTASMSTTALPVGSNTVTVAYSGDAGFDAASSVPMMFQVDRDGTTVAVTTSANPSRAGQAVTFRATTTATGSGASGTPTGTVQFLLDGADLGAPVALDPAGVATVSDDGLAVGTHRVTAVYSGDTAHTGATGNTVTQVVDKGGVDVAVTPPSTPSTVGGEVTLQATVTSGPPASGTPTGTVQFLVGSTPLGAPVPVGADGTAVSSTTAMPVGSNTVTARYSGDENFDAATSGPAVFVVNGGRSVVTLTGPATAEPGEAVAFAVHIAPTPPTTATPTGTVVFAANGVPLGGTVVVGSDGSATLTTTDLPEGISTVVAAYSGDETYDMAHSNTVTIEVATPRMTDPSGTPGFGASGGDGRPGTGAPASAGRGGPGTSALPATGFAAVGLAGAGMLLVLAGAVLVAERRRRSGHTPT